MPVTAVDLNGNAVRSHLSVPTDFVILAEVFPCFFLSCKANARVKLAKTGYGPHSSRLVVICVVLLLLVLFYVLFVCKCVLYYCHRVLTQLQLTNISYHIISYLILSYYIISYHKPYSSNSSVHTSFWYSDKREFLRLFGT